MVILLVLYAGCVFLMFPKMKGARRRRKFDRLDYVWIPLGGLTVMSLVVWWWHWHMR
jgi:hypothetical protein